jgi:hypothetical protein
VTVKIHFNKEECQTEGMALKLNTIPPVVADGTQCLQADRMKRVMSVIAVFQEGVHNMK